eukprot:4659291-Alexandrium_andersonii.AAC.1
MTAACCQGCICALGVDTRRLRCRCWHGQRLNFAGLVQLVARVPGHAWVGFQVDVGCMHLPKQMSVQELQHGAGNNPPSAQ